MAYYQNDFIRSQKAIFDELLKTSNKQDSNKDKKINKEEIATQNEKIAGFVFTFINMLVDIDFQIILVGGLFESSLTQYRAQADLRFLQNEGAKLLSSANNLNSLLVKANLYFKNNLSKKIEYVSTDDNEKIKVKLDVIQNNFITYIADQELDELANLSGSIIGIIENMDQYIVRLINNFNIYLNSTRSNSVAPLKILDDFEVAKEEQGVSLGGFLYSKRAGYMSGGTIYNNPEFRLNPMKRFS